MLSRKPSCGTSAKLEVTGGIPKGLMLGSLLLLLFISDLPSAKNLPSFFTIDEVKAVGLTGGVDLSCHVGVVVDWAGK